MRQECFLVFVQRKYNTARSFFGNTPLGLIDLQSIHLPNTARSHRVSHSCTRRISMPSGYDFSRFRNRTSCIPGISGRYFRKTWKFGLGESSFHFTSSIKTGSSSEITQKSISRPSQLVDFFQIQGVQAELEETAGQRIDQRTFHADCFGIYSELVETFSE